MLALAQPGLRILLDNHDASGRLHYLVQVLEIIDVAILV
jgi:hypothetical protein